MSGGLAFVVWLTMAGGNFLYQACGYGDWSRAFERSFFQAAAVLTLWIASKLYR